MVATAPPARPKEDIKPPEAHVKKTAAPKPVVAAKVPTRPGALTPSAADDRQVAVAERYLYGKGVAANCDRALGILRSAAERGNAKARTQLGALYSTGHCVARDLPTAYRWFALALRVDHDNATVEQNLQMIWRQMSPAERQLAIKLTQ
jgi:TPR repeat protein